MGWPVRRDRECARSLALLLRIESWGSDMAASVDLLAFKIAIYAPDSKEIT
jgi:hypothetical protein